MSKFRLVIKETVREHMYTRAHTCISSFQMWDINLFEDLKLYRRKLFLILVYN